MSTLTKMFDPTIYSLQPLVTTPVTIPSQTSSTTSASSNDPVGHDPSPTSDGHSACSSLKDIVVIGDAEQQKNLKEYQNDVNNEELDTVSRKTSTTSEYTSLSDYTPENTVTRESSVTTSTFQNDFAADEFIENSDGLTTLESVHNDDSYVIEISEKVIGSGVEGNVLPRSNEIVRSPEIENETIQPQRTRKISRFLVTPSTVTIDGDNERITEEPQQILNQEQLMKTDMTFDSQLNSIQQQVYNEDGSVVIVQQAVSFDAAQSQQIQLGQNSQPPGLGFSSDMIDANAINDLRNQTIDQYNATMHNKPLGPEHINTLEQLKIGLENITHAHVQTKPKDVQPAVDVLKTSGQTNEDQVSAAVETPLSYADVTAGGTVQIMNEITGQQSEFVGDMYAQQHPGMLQLQSPQGATQVTTSSQQSNYVPNISSSDPTQSATSGTMSQTTSVYNSRRTSTELITIDNKYGNDAVTLDNVESAESLRKLSHQGSVDKAEMYKLTNQSFRSVNC